MGTQRYQSRKRKAHVPAASDLMLLFMAMLPRASVEAQRYGTRLLPHVLWTRFSVCMHVPWIHIKCLLSITIHLIYF